MVTIGNSVLTAMQVSQYISTQTNSVVAQQDITLINEDKSTITIDMIRSLLADMSFASFQGKVRHICLLYVDQTTIEAQNAVLKLLEEPPKNTQFWVFTQFPQVLLPTIISRCMEIVWNLEDDGAKSQQLSTEAVSEFLLSISSVSHRALIEEAEKYPDKVTAQAYVDSLLQSIHQKNSNNPLAINTTAMNTLLETKLSLSANVSPKLALEHCFFVLKKLFS
jgi:DNA polymerase-3 subunit delta'